MEALIEVNRVQWGVGNGGFHTEDVHALAPTPFHPVALLQVVYDCGTMRSTAIIDDEIAAWQQSFDAIPVSRARKHVLVLSHFDKDHVNGLRRLHRAGFRPDLIVLPYLTPTERVLQVLANVESMTRSESASPEHLYDDEFAVWVAADPERALGELWGGVEIQVIGGPDDDRPNDEPSPVEADDGGGDIGVSVRIRKKHGISLSLPDATVLWEYRWREHRSAPSAPDDMPAALMRALCETLGLTQRQAGHAPELWRKIAEVDAWVAVAAIYRSVLQTHDLNPYSVVLWSGPGSGSEGAFPSRPRRYDIPTDLWRRQLPGGWYPSAAGWAPATP